MNDLSSIASIVLISHPHSRVASPLNKNILIFYESVVNTTYHILIQSLFPFARAHNCEPVYGIWYYPFSIFRSYPLIQLKKPVHCDHCNELATAFILDPLNPRVDQPFATCNLPSPLDSLPTVFDFPEKLVDDFDTADFTKVVFETAALDDSILTDFITGPFGPLLGLVR